MDKIREVLILAGLLAVNAYPIFAVIFWGWEMGAVFIIYWLETYIVWLFTTAKYLTGRRGRAPVPPDKPRDGFFVVLLTMVGVVTMFGVYFTLNFFRDQWTHGVIFYLLISALAQLILFVHQFLRTDGFTGIPVIELVNINVRRTICFVVCSTALLGQVLANAIKGLPYTANMNVTILVVLILLKIIFEAAEFWQARRGSI
ncbi:MAG: hypothetical protein KC897_10000 [Candidatus Omnitrophica bacterium]|nr:hypothetical protein [Candidatus Omnitrophota bacterium]MCB9721434.1 hypothetical protein [Candidatus Omnitrophota bacterium]